MFSSILVGVSCCTQIIDAPHQSVYEKYLVTLLKTINATPVLIPALGKICSEEYAFNISLIISKMDGILLTGSPSNVDTIFYQNLHDRERQKKRTNSDKKRDFTTITVIRNAIKHNIPVLGICRGMQEINVAFNGTLIEKLKSTYNGITHHAPIGVNMKEKYLPQHELILEDNSILGKYVSGSSDKTFEINSLHTQGVKRLGDNLVVEGYAPDGLIEAIRMDSSEHFIYGVQWHPEWYTKQSIVSNAVFSLFREQCQLRRDGL